METSGEGQVSLHVSREAWRCTYYLPKKMRRCRLHRLEGQKFCAEHVPTVNPKAPKAAVTKKEKVLERTPCPLDSKHTVAVSKLEEHMKKCNSRPPTAEYYMSQANKICEKDESDGESEELSIFTMDHGEKIDLIIKLIKFHQDRVPFIPNHFGIHDILLGDFVRSDIGERKMRHKTQIGSIAKILDDLGLMRSSTCIIEYGSGRGGLTFGLARVAKDRGLKNCKFLLIDRTSPRYKNDNRVKTAEFDSMIVERIKIDIEDLLVGKLPGIENYDHIVGVTKHLCGSGTDVALRSLLDDERNPLRHKVRGLIFATCCHHRIEFKDFVGNYNLPQDFSNGNFRALRQIAAWATNGDYTSSYLRDMPAVSDETLRYLASMEEAGYEEIKLKKTIGRLVKEILDNCRADDIRTKCADIGLECKLVNYVDMLTTRENVAIVAYSQRTE